MIISVIHRFGRTVLVDAESEDPAAAVPADHLTIEVEAAPCPDHVQIDGRAVRTVPGEGGARAYVIFDATRSVGFHLLRVNDREFYFATDDAKLRMEGILALLRFIGREGLSWGHQLIFSDGTSLRDSRIDYAWLVRAVPEIVQVSSEIADRPIRRSERIRILERPSGRRALVRETLALIRRSGKHALLEHPAGIIRSGNARYWPRTVVAEWKGPSIETTANRRVTILLQQAAAMAYGIMQDRDAPRHVREGVTLLHGRLRTALQLYPFSRLLNLSRTLPDAATPEEMTEERYQRSYNLWRELVADVGWEPGTGVAQRFAYVAYSDEIFQAFAAVAIAAAFGCEKVRPVLAPRLRVPCFRSATVDLYYDTDPPSPEFQNWRSESARPAEMRPDITLVDRARGAGVMMDAKYRTEGGRAASTALSECQVYMHSFRQKAIVVLYPGDGPRVAEVTGDGNTILEVAVGPFEGLGEYLAGTVRPKIDNVLQPLRALH